MKHLTIIVACVCSVGVLRADPVVSNSAEVQQEKNRAAALDAAAYINYLNYLYCVMETYNDKRILRQEFDRISIKELNVASIPEIKDDEGTLILDALIDTAKKLEELCLAEEEYKETLRDIKNKKRRATKRMVRDMLNPENIAKGADGAVRGFKTGAQLTKTKTGAVVGSAAGALEGACGPVIEYADVLDNLQFDAETAQITLDKTKRKELVDANEKLLLKETTIAKRLGLLPADILTGNQMSRLIEQFKKETREPSDLCRVLGSESSQKNFGCYAPYWSFLAALCVRKENPNYPLAIKAAEEYERVHRDIQKNDPMTAEALISKVTAMVAMESTNTTEIVRCLKKIDQLNECHKHADWSYFCARVYFDYLDDPQSAVKVLLDSIASMNTEYGTELYSYRSFYKKCDHPMSKGEMPYDADLLRARVFLRDILDKVKSGDLEKELRRFCQSHTTSTLEKLYYVGSMRHEDLWNLAKEDVMAISLKYVVKVRGNEIYVELPIQWFILGELTAKIELVKGGKVVKVLDEMSDKRVVLEQRLSAPFDLVRMRFRCWKKDIQNADAVRLIIPHGSWKNIEVTYQPAYGIDMQHMKCSSEFKFTPVRILFMGEKKDLQSPDDKLKARLLENSLVNYSANLYDFKVGKVACETNFVQYVNIDSNNAFHVAYTNPTPEETHIDIDVRYYNRYGGQVCRVELENRGIKGYEGGSWSLDWPSEIGKVEKPAYVLFQYHIEQSIWERYVTNPLKRRSIEKQAEEALKKMEQDSKINGETRK